MQITLEPHNKNWNIKFQQEKTHLTNIIGQYLHGTIEHVGSTAIKDILAKPIIDIMFGVKSLEESKETIKILEQKGGYNYAPYKTEVMHWFCKPSDEFRTHHLHLIPYKRDLWLERIKFRNILQNHKSIAAEYSKLKQDLSIKHQDNREAYTQKNGHL